MATATSTAPSGAVHPVPDDLIDALVAAFAVALHGMDLVQLAHEAERAESLPQSRVADKVRALVDAEIESRVQPTFRDIAEDGAA